MVQSSSSTGWPVKPLTASRSASSACGSGDCTVHASSSARQRCSENSSPPALAASVTPSV
nr:hypothetical protein [Duganella radicis]